MLDATGVQASQVPAISPWSAATTPEHLWDTSSLTPDSKHSLLLNKASLCSPSEALEPSPQASSARTISFWSRPTTPEDSWDAFRRTPTSLRSSLLSATPAPHAVHSPAVKVLELSPTASSPPESHTAAVVKGKPVPTAGRHSVQHRLDAGLCNAMFSGSPVAGPCKTGPWFPVRMTKKHKVRYWPQMSRVVTAICVH